MHRTSRSRILRFLILLAALLSAAALGLYMLGYRLTASGFAGPATVTISDAAFGTNIFVDGSLRTTVGESGGARFTLAPGSHQIIASKEGSWPWEKTLAFRGGDAVTLAPFTIDKSVAGEVITAADPEYYAIHSLVLNSKLPGKNSPLLSPNGTVAAWVEGNAIKAAWKGAPEDAPQYFCSGAVCTDPVAVISAAEPVLSIGFYKGRSDVLLISADDGIYGIEIDNRGTQNFEPLYKGESPRFAVSENGNFFILSGGSLIELAL